MALTFANAPPVPMAGGGFSYRATDDQGNTVAVHAGDEVIHDHGVAEVQKKARQKYAANEYVFMGAARVVTVRNLDF